MTTKKGVFIITLIFFAHIAFAQSAIVVEKSGKGNPILFLPGFTTPGSVWNETIKNFTEKFGSYNISYAGFNVKKGNDYFE